MPTTITHRYVSQKLANNAAATLRKTFRDDLVKVDGKNAVTVEADNNDKAMTAVQILNEQEAAASSGYSSIRDNPAPLSRLLGLPLLSNRQPSVTLFDEPAPLSRLLGLSTIVKD